MTIAVDHILVSAPIVVSPCVTEVCVLDRLLFVLPLPPSLEQIFTCIDVVPSPGPESDLHARFESTEVTATLVDISPPFLPEPTFPVNGASDVARNVVVRVKVRDTGKGLDVGGVIINLEVYPNPSGQAFDGTSFIAPYDGPLSGFVQQTDGTWVFDIDIGPGEYPAGTRIILTGTFPDKAKGQPSNTVTVP